MGCEGVWADIFHALASAGGPPEQVLIDSSAVKAHRCASGGKGGSKSGDRPLARRTHNQDALTDRVCRPIAFMLTGGQIADCTAGELLLERMPKTSMLYGDKGYDSDVIRCQVETRGAMPNIPPKANRRWKNCFSPGLYRNGNAIEQCSAVSRDFRRIATRYDRNANNFLAP